MTEINSELIKFNGKIGPQYLDVEDKSGGLDGTMKPITKELLQEMYVNNFPDVQSVKDADVKTELEMIKQTQTDILGRLNDGVDTRVTGSIVEEVILEGYRIRDADHHLIEVDLSKFKTTSIFVYHNLDVDISLDLRFPNYGGSTGGTPGIFDENGNTTTVNSLSLRRHYNSYINSGFNWLYDMKVGRIGFRLKAEDDAPPTTGAVYLRIFGEVYS